MHIVSTITEAVIAYAGTHAVLTYLILFLGSYADGVIGVNFIVRGEIFFIAGSTLAGMHVLNIWLVSSVVVVASILGDHTSYWIGLRYGDSLFKKGRWIFHPDNHKKGEEFFNKFGAKAVLLARLLGPLTWIMPFIAGMYRVRYREFLLFNILGVLIGVGQLLVIGYVFGSNYQKITSLQQKYFAVLIAAIAITFILYHLLKTYVMDHLMRIRTRWTMREK